MNTHANMLVAIASRGCMPHQIITGTLTSELPPVITPMIDVPKASTNSTAISEGDTRAIGRRASRPGALLGLDHPHQLAALAIPRQAHRRALGQGQPRLLQERREQIPHRRLVPDQRHALLTARHDHAIDDLLRPTARLERRGDLHRAFVAELAGDQLGGLHRAHERARDDRLQRDALFGERRSDLLRVAPSVGGQRAMAVLGVQLTIDGFGVTNQQQLHGIPCQVPRRGGRSVTSVAPQPPSFSSPNRNATTSACCSSTE